MSHFWQRCCVSPCAAPDRSEVYGYLSKNVTWETQEDRREFLHQLDAVINNWKGQLPNLLDFFQKEVIYWLLMESATDADEDASETPGKRFIDFVSRSGYKDAPEMDKDGKPLLRRTTPVHHAGKQGSRKNLAIISDLFKIYAKLDVNYIDEDGLTHFHVACWYGLDTIVEKFLELGQDPNEGFSQDVDVRHPYPPLYLALSRSHVKVAELLLRRGADLLRASVDGVTPVHMLGKINHNNTFLETFFEIVEEKHLTLQVNTIDHDGLSPLDYALARRNKKLMELLLRHGANPNLSNKYGAAPLHSICMLCCYVDLGDLLEKFFAINDELGNTVQVNAQNNDGYTPLHLLLAVLSDKEKNNAHNYRFDTPLLLVLQNCKKNVELLLRRGVDLNVADEKGFTPLHSISMDDLAKMLFEICDEKHQMVQVDAQDNEGRTPLHRALDKDLKNLAELLLRWNANPNFRDDNGQTCLHIICRRDDDDKNMAKMLFEICDEKHQMVQVDAQDNDGWTPLLEAIYNRKINLVEILLRRSACPNLVNDKGQTCLHIICRRDDDDGNMAKMLFEICDEKHRRVQVDAQDNEGQTPLHKAIFNGNINLVEILMRRGANPNLADDNGYTPLHILCLREYDAVDLAKRFFEIGKEFNKPVKVDAQDNEGWTPLHEAIFNGNINLVEILLRRGASPNLADNDKLTPLHAICERKNSDDGLAKRFFEINDELNQLVEVDAKNEEGSTPLHLALSHGCKKLNELLLKRHADPNLTNAEGRTPLHVICQREDDDVDLVKMLFEMGDKFNKPIQVDARDKSGCTALHLALNRGHQQIAEWLLRRGADLNLANAKGSTPLHLISAGKMDCADLLQTFFEISDEQTRPVEVDARDNEGKTPLHHAISHRHKKLFELLLRRGFDPNVADNDGSTALHTICMADDDDGWAKMLFEISEEKNRQVQIDVRGMLDFTPLHLALVKEKLRPVAELLLRKGAATNLVDREGSTPLHTVCKYADDEDRVRMLIEISNEENKPVEVDARDKLGRTPLLLALARGHGKGVKYLLKLGADPNLADENGSSPLHVIIKHRYNDHKLLKLFFDASKEVDRPVQVDVQDKNGRTPLQWAVAYLFLNAVDVLLDQDADLSSFVFPSKSFFVEIFGSISEMDERDRLGFKLALASKILAVVERLKKRGYEFNRSDALDIMSLFAEYGLFERSVDFDEYWYDDEEFVSKSKDIMVNPNLSLHDLIRLRPKEAAKQLKHENYVELARSNKLSDLPEGHMEFVRSVRCVNISFSTKYKSTSTTNETALCTETPSELRRANPQLAARYWRPAAAVVVAVIAGPVMLMTFPVNNLIYIRTRRLASVIPSMIRIVPPSRTI
ncbi:unnamed protein product [Trichogramma brassicae]|uniref:Uncharacterized protein n=1 Tax=Trichogramma brassicae TaxID=86971 RepID=A0A6H5IZY6_9HYME|nr:unnamed protein product [Trichogramma brassicae]